MANSLGIDVLGKRVVVKSGIYKIGPSETERTFQCDDGFGCHTFTSGKAIYGQFVNYPELGERRIDGGDLEKLVN